jgi:hypothetical protein
MTPTHAESSRSWTKVAGFIALGYYSLAVTTLVDEYHSESTKLSRGVYTDTFHPLAISEIVTWPSVASSPTGRATLSGSVSPPGRGR